ncbi:unnamed protein product [Caenorhabditis sp. 36 PRJEB53466]|nr:unnamed protein product [Caenorhabditis sp. 36 PRJEB53466]
MLLLLLLFLLLPSASSFLFPSSGGSNCGCSCTPPPSTCPTPTPCAPIMTCQPVAAAAPVSTCCNSCNTCKTRRKRRHTEVLSNATYVADHESLRRVKREDDPAGSPSNCNSEELRKIIETKIDRVTAIAKRRIQEEAESTLGGRFNVICARGDFSYVANTELFCQHSVGDVTCFLFKQLSDVVRRRLM